MKKRKKRPKIKILKDKAWSLMSEYVRKRDRCICFTCGANNGYKKMQAGHFKHSKLDYDEMNINCQCVSCNKFHRGRLDVYAERLINKYGLEKFEDLCKRANIIVKYDTTFYEEKIKELKEKISNL